MGRRARIALIVGVLSLVAFAERNAIAQELVSFTPQHHVRQTTAILSPSLIKKIDTQKSNRTISTPEDLNRIRFERDVERAPLRAFASHAALVRRK